MAIFKLRGLFAAMAIVLLASVVATFLVGNHLLVIQDNVERYDLCIAQLAEVFSTLQDAETGQRGYLLTGERAYLEPYLDAKSVIPRRLEGIEEQARAGRLFPEDVQEIERLIGLKLEELQHTIDLEQAGKKQAALDVVKDGAGEGLMQEIRSKVRALDTRLSQERTNAHAAEVSATWRRTVMFAFTALVNLAFLVWSYRRLRQEMSRQYVATLEVERQRQILAVTLASIGDAVILTDTAAQITFMNKVAEDLTGWPASEARGMPCDKIFRIINESTRQPVESPVDKVLAEGTIVGLANHTLLIRKDGSEVPIDDSGAPIRETDGTVRGVVLVFRDFTAHKEVERNLLQSKQQLEEAGKAKDVFLATLSHELRTPLTPVLATLSTWEVRGDLPAALQPDLKLIRRNIELESKLIDDLLDITRIEHGKLYMEKETVEVHSLIYAVAALFRSECLANSVQLSVSAEAQSSHIQADPARVQQVFWNIIGNAVKFTPSGGHITVTTSNPSAGELEIAVTDDGPGMSPESLQHLFESFRQARPGPARKSAGLGLGLSIARALVEAHGGTLRGESKGPGEGSTFTITLPTVTAPAVDAATVGRQTVSAERLRVFLLEDHEDTAKVLAQVLGAMGHTVVTSATVADALRKIAEREFDIILSDLGLSDGSGLDFIRTVRQTSQTPAVALTGYGMAEDIENCLKAGFDDHLTKPVDFETLQKILHRTKRRSLDGKSVTA